MCPWRAARGKHKSLSMCRGQRGDSVRAAGLCGASQALRDATGARSSAGERAYFEHNRRPARNRLDCVVWEKANAEGLASLHEIGVSKPPLHLATCSQLWYASKITHLEEASRKDTC
jgi:hypothetical protein